MSRFLRCIAFILLTWPTLAKCVEPPSEPWVTDLAVARQIATANKRLVLLHFTATWCGPCQRIERDYFTKPQVINALSASFVPVKIDIDQHRDLAEQFGVRNIPCEVVLTPAGQI